MKKFIVAYKSTGLAGRVEMSTLGWILEENVLQDGIIRFHEISSKLDTNSVGLLRVRTKIFLLN